MVKEMKTGALLTDLRRTAIGSFSVLKALPFDKVNLASLAKAKIQPEKAIEEINQGAWGK